MNNKTEEKEIVVNITEEEFQSELEMGLAEDEVLHPGRHTFRRGSFLARHSLTADMPSAPGTVSVAINLDRDVFTYFQKRAERTDSASYQTEINAVLREVMVRERA